MRRDWEQARLFVVEDVGHRPVALLRMDAPVRDLVAPAAKLRVEIGDIDKRARGKERVPEVVDLPFDFSLARSSTALRKS